MKTYRELLEWLKTFNEEELNKETKVSQTDKWGTYWHISVCDLDRTVDDEVLGDNYPTIILSDDKI